MALAMERAVNSAHSLCLVTVIKLVPLIRMTYNMVAQWLALLPHSARDTGSIPGWVTVCVEFAHSPRVCVGFLRGLRFPPTVQKMCGLGELAMLNSPSVYPNRCLNVVTRGFSQ